MKNWYNKEMLKKFKLSVENGFATQKQYDALENQMKSFDLDNDVIVNKAIDFLLSVEPEVEVCFSEILSKCFSLNALEFFDSDDLFILFNKFLKECKKRKIKINDHDYSGPVGLPFNLGFWRVVRPIVNKIVYNLSHDYDKESDNSFNTYVIFEKNKITYCCEPIDDFSHKNNCFINVSFDPTHIIGSSDEERLNEYNFQDICSKSESLVLAHQNDSEIDSLFIECGSAYVSIYDDEKGEKTINNLDLEETKELDLLFKKYMPDCFKKAIDDVEEE